LHAQQLGFIHPATKKEMSFESPLPADMESVIEKWRKYSANRND
ncbi:MAG: RNA pseudouridine synthase, partial [Bacteroidota bacterium]|nr:RNA pseudouridine synthase [Bacteroidota bacterium]